MRKLLSALPVLLFLMCAGTAHANISVTLAGSGGSVAALPTSGTYNQPAHDCIVVLFNRYNDSLGTPADTAMDTPTAVIPNYVGGNSDNIAVWIFYDSAGNATNQVTWSGGVTFMNAFYYDVSIGGNCTSSNLDLAVAASGVATGASISQTVTTRSANEAIITALFQGNSMLTAATAPTGFTAASFVPNNSGFAMAVPAYQIVSTIQSGVTLTWSGVMTAANLDMITVSLSASAPPPATVVPRRR